MIGLTLVPYNLLYLAFQFPCFFVRFWTSAIVKNHRLIGRTRQKRKCFDRMKFESLDFFTVALYFCGLGHLVQVPKDNRAISRTTGKDCSVKAVPRESQHRVFVSLELFFQHFTLKKNIKRLIWQLIFIEIFS